MGKVISSGTTSTCCSYGTYSDPKCNSFGVPQGSVLGPLLFSLFYGALEDVMSALGIDAMMYADDSQLYIIIKRSNRRVALDQLELCIDDVLCWNTQNGLKREFLRGPRERKKMWHMLWNLKTFIFRSMITYHEPINVGVFFCSNLFFISRKSTKTVTAAIRREIGRN